MDDRQRSPVVARRHSAQLLEQLRKKAGLTQSKAAKELGWSPRKQQMLEAGDQPVSDRDLDAILATFTVDPDAGDDWRALVETARSTAWWDAYGDEDLPPSAKQFIGLEHGASRIRAFHGVLVHGLLQTRPYRETILRTTGLQIRPAEQIRALTDVSRQRQEILRGPDPVELDVILDEAALRRLVGSAELMADQLRSILRVVEQQDNVTLRVIPFAAGPHAGLGGPFSILEFNRRGDEGVVHLEQAADHVTYVESRPGIYTYSGAFDQLITVAHSPDESLRMVHELMVGWDGRP